MTDSDLSELASWAAGLGVALEGPALELLSRWAGEVLAYNAAVNLTAETGRRGVLLRHLADGLAAVPALRARLEGPAPRVLDLGSGAGFIGVAVKAAWPEAEVTLMEPSKRRFDFLSLAASRLALRGLRVLRAGAGAGRAVSPRGSGFSAVLERAVAPLPEAVSLALPLAAPGGLVAAWQSAPPDPAEPELSRALARGGGRALGTVPYRLPGEGKDRCLALFERLANRAPDGKL